jgi:hypothetical protein
MLGKTPYNPVGKIGENYPGYMYVYDVSLEKPCWGKIKKQT